MAASQCLQSLAAIIESSLQTSSLSLLRSTHALIIKLLPSNPPSFLSIHLINAYSKLDFPRQASLVLLLDPSRSVVSWTALISGLLSNHRFLPALHHFRSMLRESIAPNEFSLPCALKASAHAHSLTSGRQVHALSIKSGFIADCFVGCSAFDMYSKLGEFANAHQLFEEMPIRNLASWNSVISNAVLEGRPLVAIEAFNQMRRDSQEVDSITFCSALNAAADVYCLNSGRELHGVAVKTGFESDVFVSNGLIDCYGKCNDVASAESVFNKMEKRNAVSWNIVVSVLHLNKQEENAVKHFLRFRQENVKVSDFIVSSVLTSMASLSLLDAGRGVHALSLKSLETGNVFVSSALVDMYGKCGSIGDCENAFRETRSPNVVTWNALIGGYAHQGDAAAAVSTFCEMTARVAPTALTFVSVLSACGRGGTVGPGMEIFQSMSDTYGVRPTVEHYSCVVDMMSRTGMVRKAYEFVKNMPMDPTVAIWGSLVNASRVYSIPEIGRIAAENLFCLNPTDSGNHVVLANMLSAVGKWDEATVVRDSMKTAGIKKTAGRSWIVIKNTIHVFHSNDVIMSRDLKIRAVLQEMANRMKMSGYVSDTGYALHDLEEEEKNDHLGFHSEKIALAFGLLVVPRGVPIRIFKNLRICGDCHAVFKLLSESYRREIVVRDNNRFHRFCDGRCSCNDYW